MTHPVAVVPPDGPARPIEQLRIPADLSGAAGVNRARSAVRHVGAADDLAAVAAWLARYTDTPGTLAAYRKEAERLLLWTVIQHGKPLSSLTHEDLLVYQRFVADPQPSWRWIMTARKKTRPRLAGLAAVCRSFVVNQRTACDDDSQRDVCLAR